MTPEKYKKYISQMIEKINDEKTLKQIYENVHRKFICENTAEGGACACLQE